MRRPQLEFAVLVVVITLGTSLPIFVTGQLRASSAKNHAGDKQERSGRRTDLDTDLDSSSSKMRQLLERYNTDRASLVRSFSLSISPTRVARFKKFYLEWRDRLSKLDFEAMGQDGRIDYLLFRNHLDHELLQLELQARQFAEVAELLPFAKTVFAFDDARRRMEPVNSQKVASQLNEMTKEIAEARKAAAPDSRLAAGPKASDSVKTSGGGDSATEEKAPFKNRKNTAVRAAAMNSSLRSALKNWFDYYNGYDPMFTWWAAEPYKAADQSLQEYTSFLSEKLAGVRFADAVESTVGAPPPRDRTAVAEASLQRGGPERGRSGSARPGDSSDIVGDPIGREALLAELAAEMISYTPEELIDIAHQELDWCEAEMKKASKDLGYGDDWHKALNHVKDLYVEPGKQTELIRDLAVEAIEFVDQHDLITIPPLARESWRMQMMTPERQLVNPFFTGGETISVSYPTNTMGHEQKMMSMRGNNIHFARATVFHELIPGHHLQGYMTARYKSYRSPFRTPFWGEGWALYWELFLWDMKFAKTPENRIGMLFWRMHRCARIIFSLSFHLGKMTPAEAIDFLVKRVGHEPENATAEVRRSFNGSYDPLYQAAYLLGGLQIYSLHKQLVDSGTMSNRAFHDAVLKENSIPIEMVRASLTKQKLTRDFRPNWKFYDGKKLEH